jgi:pyruvate dehydrogenase E2 component (dihydrolipoamide acetyltransferase)
MLEASDAGVTAAPAAASTSVAAPTVAAPAAPQAAVQPAPAAAGPIEVRVPDIGDFKDVAVIEVFVKAGDTIQLEQSLITVESDKASMEIPSSAAGVIQEFKVKLGDKVNIGDLLAIVQGSAAVSSNASSASSPAAPVSTPAPAAPAVSALAPVASSAVVPAHNPTTTPALGLPHASPSVRKFARELGVPLEEVKGSGQKGRITQTDVQAFTNAVMSGNAQTKAQAAKAPAGGSGVGLDLLPWPKVDFAKFGPIETKPLSRIKKISAQNLSRNWVMIPAVTYHEDADITDLEALRVLLNKENEKSGVKVTMLAFLIKACVKALQKFPEFNSSLDGDNLVMKKYFNIGFAADTPNGLVVPVVKNADQKSVYEIAQESGDLAKKARDGKLGPADMQGACFTISSLGGIGGTYFAPIVNAPEVAILGVNKSAMKPVWDGKQFVPRLTLPLSLTADHRVIDGALATRFNVYLAQLLADFRRVAL